MNINKKQYTYHGYKRVKERSNIKDKELYNLSAFAIKNGINFGDIPSGDLKSYVGYKMSYKEKRVKLYRGYVFIFFKNSKRLITCYPIPDKHLDEYKKIVLKRKRNKKKNVK